MPGTVIICKLCREVVDCVECHTIYHIAKDHIKPKYIVRKIKSNFYA